MGQIQDNNVIIRRDGERHEWVRELYQNQFVKLKVLSTPNTIRIAEKKTVPFPKLPIFLFLQITFILFVFFK